ncbi:FecR family protein [bacterium]|nr:FecR family protein [Hellea sp.]MDA9225126.1 FecR family protein [bacterium]
MHQSLLSRLTSILLLVLPLTTAADSIGGVVEQSGATGNIVRLSGEELMATLEAEIVSYDEVETQDGRLKIEFLDKTQVSLTEHTYMEIDEYVFDPDPNKSKMALNFVQGTARFATGSLGLVAKENITIQTPTASIGIRGTDFTTTVDELGRSLVILLPDEDCSNVVKLEEGCKPSGSITVTNNGGTVTLDQAFQAVMVSTLETSPTQPVVLLNLDLNQIDNMFIVSEPAEITVAKDEQLQELKGDGGLLDFDGLDANAIEQDVLADTTEDLEYTELDIDFLNVDFLKDLLDIVETQVDALAESGGDSGTGSNKLIGAIFGLNPDSQFNIIPDYEGKVFFIRQASNNINIKLARGSQAELNINDSDLGETIICLSSCENNIITITQE